MAPLRKELDDLMRRVLELEKQAATQDVRPSKVGGGGSGSFLIKATEAELLAVTPDVPKLGFVAAEIGKRAKRYFMFTDVSNSEGTTPQWVEFGVAIPISGSGRIYLTGDELTDSLNFTHWETVGEG